MIPFYKNKCSLCLSEWSTRDELDMSLWYLEPGIAAYLLPEPAALAACTRSYTCFSALHQSAISKLMPCRALCATTRCHLKKPVLTTINRLQASPSSVCSPSCPLLLTLLCSWPALHFSNVLHLNACCAQLCDGRHRWGIEGVSGRRCLCQGLGRLLPQYHVYMYFKL